MSDPTEGIRRSMIENDVPALDLEQAEQTWTTEQLKEDFEVLGFMAPLVMVKRRSDGAEGTMEFTHAPRRYFDFRPAGI